MNIQHSSRQDCWYTPPQILEMAREVLGAIDLDPASDAWGNETVKAEKFFTQAECGLTQNWSFSDDPLTVWLNPPGGKVGNKSQTALFWGKLMDMRRTGGLKHAVFMAFSAEALQNTQGKGTPCLMDFPFCIPAKRIRFVSRGVEKFAPSHSNAIVYVPGTVNESGKFRNVFTQLGAVKL